MGYRGPMKTPLLSVIAFFLSLSSASACMQSEAQIVGLVVSSAPANQGCLVKARLTWVARHEFCPLNVSRGQIVDVAVSKSCEKISDEISGVLYSSGNGYRLEE